MGYEDSVRHYVNGPSWYQDHFESSNLTFYYVEVRWTRDGSITRTVSQEMERDGDHLVTHREVAIVMRRAFDGQGLVDTHQRTFEFVERHELQTPMHLARTYTSPGLDKAQDIDNRR